MNGHCKMRIRDAQTSVKANAQSSLTLRHKQMSNKTKKLGFAEHDFLIVIAQTRIEKMSRLGLVQAVR
jgi:hypothetical protein